MTASRVANRLALHLLFRHCTGAGSPRPLLDTQMSPGGGRQVTTVLAQPRRREEKLLGTSKRRILNVLLQTRLLPPAVPCMLKGASGSVGRSDTKSFRAASRSCFGASESVLENCLLNAAFEADPGHNSKETAIMALKEYLREVKGLSDEDAERISKSCPPFTTRLARFGTVGSYADVERFLCREGENVSGPLYEPFFERRGGMLCSSTNNKSCPLSKFQLSFTGQQELLNKILILERLGVPRKNMWDVLENNMDILTWNVEELEAKIVFLEKLGVKKKDMVVFVKDPCVFTSDLEDRLGPLLLYLEEIGVEKHVLGDLMKFNPQGLIKMPVANFRERVDFLLKLGLSSSEVERSMRLFPQLVHLRLANLSEKIDYFDGLGVERENMVKIVAKLPSIFRHSITKNLVPKVEMLEGLGVSKSSIAKIVAQYPQFFGCSIDNLKHKLAFFEVNGLTGERLVKLITWHPRAFSFSVDENLSKKLKFLITKGFEVRSSSMVRALASCLSISTDSLEARFLNLQAVGFTPKEVCELVKKQPTILCLSEKTIRTKMDYLVNTMMRPCREILKCPGYLLYSLELRIKPRHRVLDLLTSKGLLRPEAYSLSTILQPREKVFEERFISLDPECQVVYRAHLVKQSEMESIISVDTI